MMAAPTFMLDTAALELAGLRLQVALCLDVESRRVLGHGVSTSADDALVAALGDAVFAVGVPEAVMVDPGPTCPKLARECVALGVPLTTIPPYSGTARPFLERAFRDLRVNLSDFQEPGQ